MAALQKKYEDRDFTVLAVNCWDEDEKTLRRFAGKHGATYPILLGGGDAAQDWGIRSLPTNFLINKEGEVVKKTGGIHEKDVPKTEVMIEKLLKL